MHVRVADTALGITAALLALPACSADTKPNAASSARTGGPADTVHKAAVLSSAALETRLLGESDLGSGYLRKPECPAQHDDVTVVGCPALSELGGDAATGGTLTFPRKAKTAFTYGLQLLGDLRGAVQRQREEAVQRHRPDLRRDDRLPDLIRD